MKCPPLAMFMTRTFNARDYYIVTNKAATGKIANFSQYCTSEAYPPWVFALPFYQHSGPQTNQLLKTYIAMSSGPAQPNALFLSGICSKNMARDI